MISSTNMSSRFAIPFDSIASITSGLIWIEPKSPPLAPEKAGRVSFLLTNMLRTFAPPSLFCIFGIRFLIRSSTFCSDSLVAAGIATP